MRRVLLAMLAVLAFAGPALAEARVALVIGNSKYGGDLPKLTNPANDAELMANTLKKLGFKVVLEKDADINKMKRAISNFGKLLTSAGPTAVGLFYYAGHGMQVAGENYLIPLNADIQSAGDADLNAINANSILKQMEFAGNALNIIILDACRNNPLSRGMRSADQGLARIDAPMGSFIAYSTSPNATAADGSGKNSPYTLALSRAMQKPGIPIEEAFRDARVEVIAATQKAQIPWESSSLTGAFTFNPGARAAETKETTEMVSTAPLAPGPATALSTAAARTPEPAPATGGKGCTNCPEMVAIKGGTFTMGAPDDEEGRTDVEGPQKTITIKPFSIGKNDVTVAQFAEFIKATKYHPNDECDTEGSNKMTAANWTDPEISQSQSDPVVCVSWNDANAYVEWLAKTSGKTYRLPSESEWEYAARAGVTGAHPWSNESDACKFANIADQAVKRKFTNWTVVGCDDRYAFTSPVGSLKPNTFGLYDMLGNVKNWVGGCAVDSLDDIPADGEQVRGTCDNYRPVRGSAWNSLPKIVRLAYREKNPPTYAASNYGFRVAMGQ
jgi:formylglycine-generating enzyme required for sulfatase activity